MKILIRHRRMRCLIWVCTVFLCPIKRMLGLYELNCCLYQVLVVQLYYYITVLCSLFFDSVICFISEDHKFLCTKGGGYSPDVDFPTGKNTAKESMYEKHRYFPYAQKKQESFMHLCTGFEKKMLALCFGPAQAAFNLEPLSVRQQNAIRMAFCWLTNSGQLLCAYWLGSIYPSILSYKCYHVGLFR